MQKDIRHGQATLSMVFVIGGIIFFAAVSIALLVISILASSYGFESATTAEAAASAGVEDALMRLSRKFDYSGTFSLSSGSVTANVTVTSSAPGQVTIISLATAKGSQQSVQAIVTVNSSTGQVDLLSWQ